MAPAPAARVRRTQQRNAGIDERHITDLLPTRLPRDDLARAGRIRAVAVVLAELEATGETRLLLDADQPGRAVVGLFAPSLRTRACTPASASAGTSSATGGLQVSAPAVLTEHFSRQPQQPLWHTGSHIPGPGVQPGNASKQGPSEASLASRASTMSTATSGGRLSTLPSGFRQHTPRSHLKPSGHAFAPASAHLSPPSRMLGL